MSLQGPGRWRPELALILGAAVVSLRAAAMWLTGTGERQIMAAIEAALDGPLSEANAIERGLA